MSNFVHMSIEFSNQIFNFLHVIWPLPWVPIIWCLRNNCRFYMFVLIWNPNWTRMGITLPNSHNTIFSSIHQRYFQWLECTFLNAKCAFCLVGLMWLDASPFPIHFFTQWSVNLHPHLPILWFEWEGMEVSTTSIIYSTCQTLSPTPGTVGLQRYFLLLQLITQYQDL